uniref:Photosystem I reaction center subunit IX n=1 Tax=Odontella aurita TaxID=265563 RepID=A0A7S4I5G4_9STRA|mmetsp:Transcript_20259/g.58575  ORF Transcript_20259/g.58575 Transcript_20259/m.58575 type:complete len:162 (+) Transcript_20259:466-951(+)|eukprot:CAMPEP_0113542550 /NCGR_PEP_ID=MMETSP0015_2-20120614/9674_1 /TAXON_ID=2838 /ORGANISM="Odontella" /LENGTH=161 /DNA_ID=CAMNT_0000442629 /DNA_START=460 /DNA_END=945 /DNA_ORIENTATION=+ /assembly_acc=CAM_ASM_000160
MKNLFRTIFFTSVLWLVLAQVHAVRTKQRTDTERHSYRFSNTADHIRGRSFNPAQNEIIHVRSIEVGKPARQMKIPIIRRTQDDGGLDSSKIDDVSDKYEEAKEKYQQAKNTTEELLDAYDTAPNEWTSTQKWGVAIGVIAAAFVACCLLFKFVPCLKCCC